MNTYPVLVRNQGHDYPDYTLRLADNIDVRLTEQQVLSLREQIEQDQKPISDEDAADLRAALADVRDQNRRGIPSVWGGTNSGGTNSEWVRHHSHLGGLNVRWSEGHRVCNYCGECEP